jgi:Mg2+ and Co2+ transporter CorA
VHNCLSANNQAQHDHIKQTTQQDCKQQIDTIGEEIASDINALETQLKQTKDLCQQMGQQLEFCQNELQKSQ